MHTQIVKPATGRFEGAYLLLVSVVILAVSGLLISQRQTKIETVELQPYQISAFSDLGKTEQAVFNDLYAAALELQSVHRDSKAWLSLEDVQDLVLPPFAESAQNASRVGHRWSGAAFESAGLSTMAYFGKSARLGEARNFLLVMSYRPPPPSALAAPGDPNAGRSFSIWVNGSGAAEMPATIGTSVLTDLGWREAVAFKGEQAQRGVTTGAPK